MVVAMEERCNTNKQFIEKNTKGPPINRMVMAITDDHFWGEVLRCPAERI
jgi:hypothetical protein